MYPTDIRVSKILVLLILLSRANAFDVILVASKLTSEGPGSSSGFVMDESLSFIADLG